MSIVAHTILSGRPSPLATAGTLLSDACHLQWPCRASARRPSRGSSRERLARCTCGSTRSNRRCAGQAIAWKVRDTRSPTPSRRTRPDGHCRLRQSMAAHARRVALRGGTRRRAALNVEIVCSDAGEHRRRVESREPDIAPRVSHLAGGRRARLPRLGSRSARRGHRGVRRHRRRPRDRGPPVCTGMTRETAGRRIVHVPESITRTRS